MFYYTDSRNALCWINTPAHSAKTYVYNRSAEIQRVSEPNQWAHVATDVNPADVATRIVSTEDLKENKIWFQGPPFLKNKNFKFEKFVPKPSDITPEVTKELKSSSEISLNYFAQNSDFLQNKIDRLSVGKYWNNLHNFRKLLMQTALSIAKWRKIHSISKYELHFRANTFIYRLSQQASFPREIGLLKKEEN